MRQEIIDFTRLVPEEIGNKLRYQEQVNAQLCLEQREGLQQGSITMADVRLHDACAYLMYSSPSEAIAEGILYALFFAFLAFVIFRGVRKGAL